MAMVTGAVVVIAIKRLHPTVPLVSQFTLQPLLSDTLASDYGHCVER